ncbi:uncharacterized protein LOC100164831 isoform X2 [Acyrthosiphon pisum]|uniref:Uncharacterized protein n=1 Tax=Acyrthosiphon pisum TaxID=7029 RepID=A0A8R2B903_ACYPI|nr:uncharacterized protein LOC100164831 isoform X2 [Acyrthosiphon pisum]|eukprot:XP_008187094.1 PREDICTED: uncharacterized protein LOC100164831 isoform X2 [Acyrthosiphon pisum]
MWLKDTRFAIYTTKCHSRSQIHLRFTSDQETIPIVIMKFVLAFVLLIGISCQIGRGDCAPETLYEEMKGMMSDSVQFVKDTYHQYMPNIPGINPDLPSVSMPDSLSSGYDTVKDGLGDMAEGAGEMAKDTMDGIEKTID